MKRHAMILVIGAAIAFWGAWDLLADGEVNFLIAGGVLLAYGGYEWLYYDEESAAETPVETDETS